MYAQERRHRERHLNVYKDIGNIKYIKCWWILSVYKGSLNKSSCFLEKFACLVIFSFFSTFILIILKCNRICLIDPYTYIASDWVILITWGKKDMNTYYLSIRCTKTSKLEYTRKDSYGGNVFTHYKLVYKLLTLRRTGLW